VPTHKLFTRKNIKHIFFSWIIISCFLNSSSADNTANSEFFTVYRNFLDLRRNVYKAIPNSINLNFPDIDEALDYKNNNDSMRIDDDTYIYSAYHLPSNFNVGKTIPIPNSIHEHLSYDVRIKYNIEERNLTLHAGDILSVTIPLKFLRNQFMQILQDNRMGYTACCLYYTTKTDTLISIFYIKQIQNDISNTEYKNLYYVYKRLENNTIKLFEISL